MRVQHLFTPYKAENFYWNLAFLSLVIANICGNNICPTEYSTEVNGNEAKWESQGAENELVISLPACLNEANNLITRICINGTWNPQAPPNCHSTANENTPCPDNFQYVDDYCVQVTKSIDSLEQTEDPQNRYFRLPVRRVVKFGPFEYTEIGKTYGETFPINAQNYEQFYKSDCLVLDTKHQTIQMENCTKPHEFVQYFPRNFVPYTCPRSCVPGESLNPKCYCKRNSCKNLANVESIVQKKKLQMLIGDDICRIDEMAPNKLALQLYLTKDVLQYRKSGSNCAICELRTEDENPKLVLSFEEAERKLYLLIYSPEGIQHIDDIYTVYCFTNADDDTLKYKCDMESVFEHYDENTRSFSILVYKIELQKYMGEYWCEAFSTSLKLLKSNKVIAYQKKRGNEYSLRVYISNVCKTFPCDLPELISDVMETKLMVLEQFNAEIRVMEIFKFDTYTDSLDILFHVSTGHNQPVETEYMDCASKLISLKDVQVIYFRSSEYCLSETTLWGDYKLTWPLTQINNAAVSTEFCLMKEDQTPVTRFCNGTFLYGANWSVISGKCDRNVSVPKVTQELREFATAFDNKTSLHTIWNEVSTIEFNILDIYYLNILLRNFGENDNDSSSALNIMNKLIQTDRNVLKRAQHVLNLTDITLEQIDSLFSRLSTNPESVLSIRSNELLVHISNPFLTNVSGLLLYNTTKDFTTYQLVNFQRNDTFDMIHKTDLVLGVYTPELVLDQILNETNTNISDIFLVTVIFSNDNLFIDDKYQSDGYIISVTIPSFGSYLQTPIPVIFKSNRKNLGGDVCGFWDVGKKSNSKTGEWSMLGSNYAKINDTNLHQCSFVHLTHFALLLMSDEPNIDENDVTIVNSEESNEIGLEVMTIIGSILSVFGIVGIFLTALLFGRWRKKLGTKILLNLSIAIFLELICIHLTEIKWLRESEYECKIVGMTLHYLVLSQFCWMLIYAFLQYYRFVKVIGSVPNNLMLKSLIFGWGVPLILVFIVGLTTTQSYVSKSFELCYPRGNLLYLSVIMPVCVIILANIIIFCLIMYNITFTKTTSIGKKVVKLRLYLALLLFSVLGIPWVFGLLAEMISASVVKMVLFYLFCLTATLQGFVLFLFYVILNKDTRQFWVNYLKMRKL